VPTNRKSARKRKPREATIDANRAIDMLHMIVLVAPMDILGDRPLEAVGIAKRGIIRRPRRMTDMMIEAEVVIPGTITMTLRDAVVMNIIRVMRMIVVMMTTGMMNVGDIGVEVIRDEEAAVMMMDGEVGGLVAVPDDVIDVTVDRGHDHRMMKERGGRNVAKWKSKGWNQSHLRRDAQTRIADQEKQDTMSSSQSLRGGSDPRPNLGNIAEEHHERSVVATIRTEAGVVDAAGAGNVIAIDHRIAQGVLVGVKRGDTLDVTSMIAAEKRMMSIECLK
jgi:hypothetical protein